MARIVTPSPRALVTLEEAEIFISPNDTLTLDDKAKDSLQRIINQVSESFESKTNRFLIKKNITEYWDGGFPSKITKYAPVWSYKDSSDKVYIYDNEYDFLVGDIEFNIVDTDDDTTISLDDYSVDPDSGITRFDFRLVWDMRRYKIQYTTGFWADSTEVPEMWKQMCLTAVDYYFDKDVALWARESEGAVIYPRNLPINVEIFLKEQGAVRA